MKVLDKGQLSKNYSEQNLKDYMKSDLINITIEMNLGKKFYLLYYGFNKIFRN